MSKAINSKILINSIGCRCVYCHRIMTESGPGMPSRDHVMPKSKGYGLNNNNRVICCEKCNSSKAQQHIVSWWYRLKRGGDKRASIIFAFIMQRHEQGLLQLSHGIKKVPMETFRAELKQWTKPLIALTDYNDNIVSRIGSDEVAVSLSATWQ